MKKKIITFIGVLILMLTVIIGVQFTKKLEKQNTTIQTEKIELRYDTLENIMHNADQELQKKYDNFKLPSAVYPVSANKLYTYKHDTSVRYGRERAIEEAKKLYTLLTGIEVTDEMLETDDVPDQDGSMSDEIWLHAGKDKGAKFSVGIYSYGSFSVSTGDASMCEANAIKNNAVYMVKRDGVISDDSFEVSGEQYTIREAVDFANNYWKESGVLEYLDSRITLELQAIVVRETKGTKEQMEKHPEPNYSTNYMLAYFDILYDGVPLCDTSGFSGGNDDNFHSATCSILIDKKNHAGKVECMPGINILGVDETENKYVTLGSCLDLVSNYLASESGYKVSEVGIRYCALRNPNVKGSFERKPYWRIVLSERKTADMRLLSARAIYVDMITGDLYLFDDDLGMMLGSQPYK